MNRASALSYVYLVTLLQVVDERAQTILSKL